MTEKTPDSQPALRQLSHDTSRLTRSEMLEIAREGFFVRDTKMDVIYCPQGQELRRKALKKNGFTRYARKQACHQCKNKCCTTSYKEIDFSPKKNIMPTPEKRMEMLTAGIRILKK
jgi:transposase